MTLIRQLSIEQYHADAHAVSKSQLDDLDRSPAIFYAKNRDPNRPARLKPTAAMNTGNLAHCAILEPEHFDDRYIVGPDLDKRTKEWKEFAASTVKTIITPSDKDQVFAMSESVRKLPILRDALALGEAEVSAYWTDPATDVQCRCRPDWVWADSRDTEAFLIDVKTCADASPEGFAKAVVNWSYAKQAAFYSDGYAAASGRRVQGFIFAAVEKTWPYAAAAYILSDEDMEWGRNQYRANLHTYAECMKTNIWPGYTNGLQTLILPAWATNNHEEIEIGYAE